MKRETFGLMGAGLLLQTLPLVAGVPVGQSTVVGERMWSDTFTVAGRCASGYFNNAGQGDVTRVDSVYMVEYAVGATQWRRPANFSFNTPADAVTQYAHNNTGNEGAATGFAQSGSNYVAFRGVLPTRVAFQMDARATCDFIAIATYSADLPDAGNGFLVKFYNTDAVKIAAYGAAEVDTGLTMGFTGLNTQWHNYAVIFDRAAQQVEIFIDEVSRGTVALASLGVALNINDRCIGMGCAGYVAWYDNVQVGVPAKGGSDLALEAWRTEPMAVETASRRAPILADGTVRKTGAGTLDLGGAAIRRGTVEVREGTVAVDATDPGLPGQLQENLAFWVDANVNVTAVGGKVTEWRDCREAAGGTNFVRAVAYTEGEAPTLVDGTGTAAGRKLVDFGTFGQSNAGWLQWRNAAGARQAVNVVTAIYVLECPNGGGAVLGDWSGVAGNPTGDTNWAPTMTTNMTSMVDALMTHNSSHNAFVDDVECHSGALRFTSPLTVYAFNRGGGAYPCSTFFNDRNVRVGDPMGNDTFLANHQGGGRLAEVLLWTRTLNPTEVHMVNAYLLRKWKGGISIGNARIAKGATLRVAADATHPPVLKTLAGAGCVEVTGSAGSVQMAASQAPQITPSVDLAVGTSLTTTEDGRVNAFPAVVRAGRSYDVTTTGIAATAGADPAVAEKTGAGTLVASALPTGVVRVAAGALRLTASQDVWNDTLVPNADFEDVTRFRADVTVGNADVVTWGYNATVADWTLGKGVSGGVDASGVATSPNGPLTTGYKTSSGAIMLFVQVDGSAETTVTVPAAGYYRLEFTAVKRNGAPLGLLDVQVDGTTMGRIQVNDLEPRTFALAFPVPLAAGAHTLRFQGVLVPTKENAAVNYDTMALIDDVRLTADATRLGTNLVHNGSFELHDPLTDPSSNPSDKPYRYAPTGTGWVFVDPAQTSVTNAGITQGENVWVEYPAAEGSCMAFLRKTGYFAQDITFPEPGRYRLSFIQRGRFNAGQWNYSGQTFKVFLGSTQVAYLQGSNWEPQRTVVELPEIDADHLVQSLSFKGLNSTADASTMFDDIRIERYAGILANPSFEWAGTFSNGTWQGGLPGAGWTFDVGDGPRDQSGICNRNGPWASASGVLFGDACAFLQMRARISQVVTVPADGIYEVSFWARRRSVTYADHDFRVVCGGMALGSVTTRGGDDWKRFSFRTPFLKAGGQVELAFEGINHGDNTDRASVIDGVAFDRVDDGVTPEAEVFAGASVELAEGAVLELDFDGVAQLQGLSYAGHAKSGELSAANCAFIRGAGAVFVRSRGLQILIR